MSHSLGRESHPQPGLTVALRCAAFNLTKIKGANHLRNHPLSCGVAIHLVVIGERLFLLGADLGEDGTRLVEEDEGEAQAQRQPEGDQTHAKPLLRFEAAAVSKAQKRH